MEQSFQDMIKQLEQINLVLRHMLELAEAAVPAINLQIQRFSALGLPDDLAFTGDVISTSPYLPGLDLYDSGQVIQAVLLIPEGIGAAIWDSEEYAMLERAPEGVKPEVFAHFKPFDECSSLVKALLVNQAQDLLAQLKKSIRLRLD